MAIIKDKLKTFWERIENYSVMAERFALDIWRRWRIEVVFISGGVALIVFLNIMFWGRLDNTNQANLNDVIRTALLGLGGLGALYGLVLGAKRTNNAQAQLFNDRLGRGVELLANDSITLRVAGIRLLDNLAETASRGETLLIVQLLYDFVRTKAKLTYKTDQKSKKKVPLRDIRDLGDRVDIALSIKAVLRFAEYSPSFSFAGLDLRGLNLSNIDFENADLRNSDLSYAQLGPLTLDGADFSGANLQKIEFDFTDGQSLREKDIVKNVEWSSGISLLDDIIYEEENPPVNIPLEFTLPEHGAYSYDDIGVRQFV